MFNGEDDFIIRVDHPSDIAVLRGDDPAVSLIMQLVSEGKKITPLQWKDEGDKVYLTRNYNSAIEWFVEDFLYFDFLMHSGSISLSCEFLSRVGKYSLIF